MNGFATMADSSSAFSPLLLPVSLMPVIPTILTVGSSTRRAATRVGPSISGIIMSVSTSWISCWRSLKILRASFPRPAVITWYPNSASVCLITSRTAVSSSTTRMPVPCARGHGLAESFLTATSSVFVAGRYNSNVVPCPTLLAIRMKPPWLRTMPSVVLSPSPVPLPTSLVVKNGSNNFAWISGGMPVPVSVTRRQA